jgi:hypothetical protein
LEVFFVVLAIENIRIIPGADEENVFEPDFAAIARWLVDNPLPTWTSQLMEAGRAPRVQTYAY